MSHVSRPYVYPYVGSIRRSCGMAHGRLQRLAGLIVELQSSTSAMSWACVHHCQKVADLEILVSLIGTSLFALLLPIR